MYLLKGICIRLKVYVSGEGYMYLFKGICICLRGYFVNSICISFKGILSHLVKGIHVCRRCGSDNCLKSLAHVNVTYMQPLDKAKPIDKYDC